MKRFLLKVLVISICLITIISLMACGSKKVKVVEIGLSEEKICVDGVILSHTYKEEEI